MEAKQQSRRPPIALPQHKSFYFIYFCKISLGKKKTGPLPNRKKERKKLKTTNCTIMCEIRKKMRNNGILTVIKSDKWQLRKHSSMGLIHHRSCVYMYIQLIPEDFAALKA